MPLLVQGNMANASQLALWVKTVIWPMSCASLSYFICTEGDLAVPVGDLPDMITDCKKLMWIIVSWRQKKLLMRWPCRPLVWGSNCHCSGWLPPLWGSDAQYIAPAWHYDLRNSYELRYPVNAPLIRLVTNSPYCSHSCFSSLLWIIQSQKNWFPRSQKTNLKMC